MKTLLSFIFSLFAIATFGQTISCDSLPNNYTGFCTTTYSDGVLKTKTTYLNGVKHGAYEEYYHFGKLGAKGSYENGQLAGTFERYSPTGSVTLRATIDQTGNGEFTKYNFKGTVSTFGKFEDWRKAGVWKNYNYKGKVRNKTTYNTSNSTSVDSTLIEEYGFGKEPEGIVDFPTYESDFVGGPEALSQYVSTHVEYPEEAARQDITGKVYVSFIINTDGSISDAKVVRNVHPLLDKEALRLVNSMPLWTPAIEGGMHVRSRARFPITFTLGDY